MRKTVATNGRRAFTVVEFFVVLIVVVILVALLAPAVRMSGEAARRMQCSNNLKQLALAAHNYESAYHRFPAAMGGTGAWRGPLDGNHGRLSGLVALLPFIEGNARFDQIALELTEDSVVYPPFGPAPWIESYPPWREQISFLNCPNQDGKGPAHSPFGTTTYAFCIGDTATNLNTPTRLRGAFAAGLYSKISDFSDGTSTTILIAEIGLLDDRLPSGTFAVNRTAGSVFQPLLCRQLATSEGRYRSGVELSGIGRGSRWADGGSGIGMVNTILPPNSASCSIKREAADGIFSAGSLHTGGINLAMADGSVQFISNNIDCGDLTRPPPSEADYVNASVASPYGVWGALGTASGGDAEQLTKEF